MSIADVVIIAVIVLGALLGLWFGTSKSLITLLAWAGSFVIALFVTRAVAYALIDVEPIRGFVFNGEGFSIFSLIQGSDLITAPPATGILGAIFVPLLGPAAEVAAELGYAAEAVNGAAISYAIFSAAVCLALMLAIRLVMIIFTWILKKIFNRGNKPSPLSRLGGFVFNGAKGLASMIIIFMLIAPALAFPILGVIPKDIDDKSFIAKPVFGFFGKFTTQTIAGNEDKMKTRLGEIIIKTEDLIDYGDTAEEEFTVTFETNGGSEVPAQIIQGGSQLADPGDPTRSGYRFEGWFLDDELSGEPVTFPQTVDGGGTLYAKWVEVFTVTFETFGGTAIDALAVEEGGLIAEPAAPTKEGFIFDGWYLAYDGDAAVTNPMDFETYEMPAENITLYAKWAEEAPV